MVLYKELNKRVITNHPLSRTTDLRALEESINSTIVSKKWFFSTYKIKGLT